ncbi:hypothetical protein PAL_GLEAN10024763 [Pteropus alecto]|uniref:Uncharacterized protein n=1 Tax=Pteropus alecto TaxID=9402 RepID=L5K1R3_PTEAL|nr:hypothetical protein PAL_GLEAN10024763 [Pteropus alecto]
MRWGATPSRPHCRTEQDSGLSQDALKKRHNRKINTALKPAGVTTTTEKTDGRSPVPSKVRGGLPPGPKQAAGQAGPGTPQPAGDARDLQSARPGPPPTAEAWLEVSPERAGVPAVTTLPWNASTALPPPGVLGPGRHAVTWPPQQRGHRGARQPASEGASPPSRLVLLMPPPRMGQKPRATPPVRPKRLAQCWGLPAPATGPPAPVTITQAVATAVLYKTLRNLSRLQKPRHSALFGLKML